MVPPARGEEVPDVGVQMAGGIYLGWLEQSGEHMVGIGDHVVKARDLKRKPESERWSSERLLGFSRPEFEPNRDSADIRVKIRHSEPTVAEQPAEYVPQGIPEKDGVRPRPMLLAYVVAVCTSYRGGYTTRKGYRLRTLNYWKSGSASYAQYGGPGSLQRTGTCRRPRWRNLNGPSGSMV